MLSERIVVYTISNTWEMDREREMKLPIYIEAAMGVFLVVILAMAGKNGMIPQNQKNNVMKQSETDRNQILTCKMKRKQLQKRQQIR